MTTPTAAANAYASLARCTIPRGGSAEGAPTAAPGGELRRHAQGRDRRAERRPRKQSDAQTQAMAAGKANIVDVVTAVAETEVAIDALVSVRDRVIHGYEEIMKMPI